jgi:AraC-like DNA-binding protein
VSCQVCWIRLSYAQPGSVLSSAHDGEDDFRYNRTNGCIDAATEISVTRAMENAAVLTLAALCLGIALTGLIAAVLGQSRPRERLSLGLVYVAFIGMITFPLVRIFAEAALTYYMPLLLVMLLALPPAFYHYIVAKTSVTSPAQISWRDLALPLTGSAVCIGFWILPAKAKNTLFISGELPPGILPGVLAMMTFVLILVWILASFAYLIAILRRLTDHRANIRQLYSDVEKRDLRWVDVVMVLLVMIWAAGAISLADENLASGTLLAEEVLFALTACCLLALNIFSPIAPPVFPTSAAEDEPDLKYARSALTSEHMAKLATRIETAMRKDVLYLDPDLSLQKLSREVAAVPNQVSQTLNQEIGATFFDYVAHWRIKASKPLIAAGNASVLAVALDVGFNSRSTFYKAFKRETNMTPKDYRASQINAG